MIRHWAVFCLSVFFLAACTQRPTLHSFESFVFGTRVEVLVWSAEQPTAQSAAAAVLAEFDRLHKEFHAWQPSQLTTLNAALARGEQIAVSDELAGYLRQAQQFFALGDGLFDPGIGGLIQLWGFQGDNNPTQLPPPQALKHWRHNPPSIADLVISGNVVHTKNTAVAVDFGGYLKGVALDRASTLLKARGVRDALINIGGNVLALGSKGGVPWRVGLQHPRTAAPMATLDLSDGEAVGTSGDYQRYFEVAGRRYCHLLDPRKGEPAAATQAVSLIISAHPEAGTWSDWASKPLFIAGDAWRPLAEKLGLSQVLRVSAEGRVEMTAAMQARLKMATVH